MAKRALVVVHGEKAEAVGLARRTVERLSSAGFSVALPMADADVVQLTEHASDDVDVDLVVSLGGDGTVLRAVSLVAHHGTPVLAINLGVLGYLTEVEPHDLDLALDRFCSGSTHVEERMMLEATIVTGPMAGTTHRALNELVVEKQEAGHTIRLLPSINGVPFTPYAADGIIVATPTGSTAYNLSARGPILSPRLRALILTPVSPHMLFDRPLVMDDDEVISIEVQGHRRAALTVDGRSIGVLDEGDVVEVRVSPVPARFVRLGRRDFHQLLKAKFSLVDR